MKDELIDLSHAIARAIAERDSESLNAILDDDFVHLATGHEPTPPQDKATFVDAIGSASYEIVAIEVHSLRVKFTNDMAVVVGIQDADVKLPDGRRVTWSGSFTDVFRGVDGRWQLWLAHSTELGAC